MHWLKFIENCKLTLQDVQSHQHSENNETLYQQILILANEVRTDLLTARGESSLQRAALMLRPGLSAGCRGPISDQV